MIGVINNKIRKSLKESLRVYGKEIENPFDKTFGMSNLEDIFKISRKVRRGSKQEIRKNLDTQLSIANLHVVCCFLMTTSLYSEENNEESILSATWLNPHGLPPNPNSIFQHLLTQLVLLSLSVIELIETGLDSPARTMSRSVAELSWQILILLAFKEDLQEYISPETFEETNKIWFKLFGKGRTQKKLTKIEEMINFEDEKIDSLKMRRKEDYQFFSESVHNSYVMTMVGTIRWSFEEEVGAWSAFGGSSSTSITTIEFTNHTLNYFVQMFFLILNDLHDIQPNLRQACWRDVLILKESISTL